MLQHSFGGALTFVSLQHFIAPVLDKIPTCPPDKDGKQKGHLILEEI